MSLSVKKDGFFFIRDTVTKDDSPLQGYYNQHRKRVYDIQTKKNNTLKSIYKDKWVVFTVFDETKNLIFKKERFKEDKIIHKLTIGCSGLKEIKSLPKGLLSLWLQGLPLGYKFPKSVIPKTIVSIFFRWSEYTLGDDLSSFKDLKVFGAPNNRMVFAIPKFPKSIEYIDLSGCNIGSFEEGLKNFKLEDYPNLKYFDIRNNPIRKIPVEWKKSKKMLYGKVKKMGF